MTRQRITPAWLRPVAVAAVITVHAGMLVGFAWPASETPAVTAPVAVQVVPPGAMAEAYNAPREVQVAEVTETATASSEAQEAAPELVDPVTSETAQTAEVNERSEEIQAAEAVPVGPQASLIAAENPTPEPDVIHQPRPRPKPALSKHKRDKDEPEKEARPASRASAVAHESHAEAVTGAIASASYRSIVAAELNRRKFYPPSARAAGLEGVVVVSFTIASDGHVRDHAIVRSSGQPQLDDAARRLMSAMSLPPPPGGVFRATVPIRYNIED